MAQAIWPASSSFRGLPAACARRATSSLRATQPRGSAEGSSGTVGRVVQCVREDSVGSPLSFRASATASSTSSSALAEVRVAQLRGEPGQQADAQRRRGVVRQGASSPLSSSSDHLGLGVTDRVGAVRAPEAERRTAASRGRVGAARASAPPPEASCARSRPTARASARRRAQDRTGAARPWPSRRRDRARRGNSARAYCQAAARSAVMERCACSAIGSARKSASPSRARARPAAAPLRKRGMRAPAAESWRRVVCRQSCRDARVAARRACTGRRRASGVQRRSGPGCARSCTRSAN